MGEVRGDVSLVLSALRPWLTSLLPHHLTLPAVYSIEVCGSVWASLKANRRLMADRNLSADEYKQNGLSSLAKLCCQAHIKELWKWIS